MKKNTLGRRHQSLFLKGDTEIGVLLFHGWTAIPEEFLPLGKFLNSFGYTVSAPLLRGHGTKPEDLKDITWEDWRDGAREALWELGKHSKKIFVGGLSIGGDLAMLVSEEKKVFGVIPLGASVKYKLQGLAKVGLFFMGLTKDYRRKYYPPSVRKYVAKREVYSYYPIQSAKEVIKLAEATRKFLPQITKPILVMQSTADHMLSRRNPQIIVDSVKSKIKEIYWLKNAYHVFVDNPLVHQRIAKFISEISELGRREAE